MRRLRKVAGIVWAGFFMSATVAGAAGLSEGGVAYNNTIHEDTFMQEMVDNRTSDARYQNTVSLDSFIRQLGDRRASDAPYRNVMTTDAFEQQLDDNYTPPYRNVFSVERFYTVIGDPCLAEGATDGPVLSARCEIR